MFGNQQFILIKNYLPGHRWIFFAGAWGLLSIATLVALVYVTRRKDSAKTSKLEDDEIQLQRNSCDQNSVADHPLTNRSGEIGCSFSMFAPLHTPPLDIFDSLPIFSDLETAVSSIGPTLFPSQCAHFKLEVDGQTTVYALWRPEDQATEEVCLFPLDLEKFPHEGSFPIETEATMDSLGRSDTTAERRKSPIALPRCQGEILHTNTYLRLWTSARSLKPNESVIVRSGQETLFVYKCPFFWDQAMRHRAEAIGFDLPSLFYGPINSNPPEDREIYAWLKTVASQNVPAYNLEPVHSVSSLQELTKRDRHKSYLFGQIEGDGYYIALRIGDKVYTMKLPDSFRAKNPEANETVQFNFEGREHHKMFVFLEGGEVCTTIFFTLLYKEAMLKLRAGKPYLDFKLAERPGG